MRRFDDPVSVQQRDKTKRHICELTGISLLVIPFWWNKKMESVAQAIHAIRPDIEISSHLLKGDIIPTEMPYQRPLQGSVLHVITRHRRVHTKGACGDAKQL